jgi:hypothetical protein
MNDHSVAAAASERQGVINGLRESGLAVLAEEESRYEDYMAAAQAGLLQNTSVTVMIGEQADEGANDPPPVTFLVAELLSGDKDPEILRKATFEPTGFGTNVATLNIDTSKGPAALSGDVFTVRVTFQLPEYTKLFATSTADFGSRVIFGNDNRYRFPTEKEAPFGSAYAFYDDGNRHGHVEISLKVRDIEGTRNSIFVTVAGAYQNGEFFSGQASLKLIGNGETPKKRKP